MILIAELDKELVIVRFGIGFSYQTFKISKLFAFCVYNMQNPIGRRFQSESGIETFSAHMSVCCATAASAIAISATSDHVIVSHNISSMKLLDLQ